MPKKLFSESKRRDLVMAIGGNAAKPPGERLTGGAHAKKLGIDLSTYWRYKRMATRDGASSGSIPLDAIPDRTARRVAKKRAEPKNLVMARRLLAFVIELLGD